MERRRAERGLWVLVTIALLWTGTADASAPASRVSGALSWAVTVEILDPSGFMGAAPAVDSTGRFLGVAGAQARSRGGLADVHPSGSAFGGRTGLLQSGFHVEARGTFRGRGFTPRAALPD